ncbi:hypothetical protein ANN_19380 [Periplaneta americana]|uniref:DUF4817 domain-containing protein n=1 Tax=Periplaneta americana TaxID=6978 RepID=A0ABQ8SA99_PERAM|nr:hypothetical protein ANN_19380 [Periplaneta americana]
MTKITTFLQPVCHPDPCFLFHFEDLSISLVQSVTIAKQAASGVIISQLMLRSYHGWSSKLTDPIFMVLIKCNLKPNKGKEVRILADVKILVVNEVTMRKRTARAFNKRHPEKNVSHRYVIDLIQKFEETDSVCNIANGQPRKLDETLQIEILRHFINGPTTSVPKIAAVTNISVGSIRVVSTEHTGDSISYPLKTQCTMVHSVAASGYALYLSLLHDGAHGTALRTLCTFQRVLTTTVLIAKIIALSENMGMSIRKITDAVDIGKSSCQGLSSCTSLDTSRNVVRERENATPRDDALT